MKFKYLIEVEVEPDFSIARPHHLASQEAIWKMSGALELAVTDHRHWHLQGEGPEALKGCWVANGFKVLHTDLICRSCGTGIRFDRANHPMDLGLCVVCNENFAQAELGMV